jgi:hypothetical protein
MSYAAEYSAVVTNDMPFFFRFTESHGVRVSLDVPINTTVRQPGILSRIVLGAVLLATRARPGSWRGHLRAYYAGSLPTSDLAWASESWWDVVTPFDPVDRVKLLIYACDVAARGNTDVARSLKDSLVSLGTTECIDAFEAYERAGFQDGLPEVEPYEKILSPLRGAPLTRNPIFQAVFHILSD